MSNTEAIWTRNSYGYSVVTLVERVRDRRPYKQQLKTQPKDGFAELLTIEMEKLR